MRRSLFIPQDENCLKTFETVLSGHNLRRFPLRFSWDYSAENCRPSHVFRLDAASVIIVEHMVSC